MRSHTHHAASASSSSLMRPLVWLLVLFASGCAPATVFEDVEPNDTVPNGPMPFSMYDDPEGHYSYDDDTGPLFLVGEVGGEDLADHFELQGEGYLHIASIAGAVEVCFIIPSSSEPAQCTTTHESFKACINVGGSVVVRVRATTGESTRYHVELEDEGGDFCS